MTAHGSATPSYEANAEGYFLTRDMMEWFWHHYLESADHGRDPMASPLLARELSGLPAATVVTAEFDPLCDEGGVPTRHVRYDGVIHGFVSMYEIVDKGRDAIELGCKRMRESFGN